MSRLSEFGTRPGTMSAAPTSAPIRARRVEFRPTLAGWTHHAMTETSTPLTVPNRRPTNEELRALVDEHAAAIYRVAIGIVRDPALAEDVVQETIIRVWKSLPTFRGESPIRGWILRSCMPPPSDCSSTTARFSIFRMAPCSGSPSP